MQYVYIKDGKISIISQELIEKRQEEITEDIKKTRKIENKTIDDLGNEVVEVVDEEYVENVIIQPFIDGMVYDEVIETSIEGRVCFENGKIIAWEKSIEKKEEDKAREIEIAKQIEEQKRNRPSEIIAELGRLKNEKDGLELLGEDTTSISAQIQSLKDEYKAL